MHVQDNRYDASYNFIQYSDKGSWSVRFTAWYLAGLLHRNEGDDLKHAEASIRNMYDHTLTNWSREEELTYETTRLACQMTDDFDAAWYGTFKLSPDQPDPTPDSSYYAPEIYVRLHLLNRCQLPLLTKGTDDIRPQLARIHRQPTNPSSGRVPAPPLSSPHHLDRRLPRNRRNRRHATQWHVPGRRQPNHRIQQPGHDARSSRRLDRGPTQQQHIHHLRQ